MSMELMLNEAKQQAVEVSKEAENALAAAQEVVVDSPLTNQRAADIRNEWVAKAKAIEAVRRKLKKPVLEAGRQIDALFNPSIKTLKKAADIVSKQMTAYTQRLLEERRQRQLQEERRAESERERHLRLAAEARQRADRQRADAEKAWEARQRQKLLRAAERDDARAEEHEAKARAIVPSIVPDPETPEGIVMAEVWDYEIVDQDKLFEAAATSHRHLRALFTIDRAALKRQVLATKDTMPIPGVRVFKRLQAKSKGV